MEPATHPSSVGELTHVAVSDSPDFALSSGSAWGPPLFVWSIWGAMLLAILALVYKFSSNVPFWDEYYVFVPVFTGHREDVATWLWEMYGYHRFPLPNLVLVTAFNVFGQDMRAAAFLNVLALGTLALLMIWIVRALRGSVRYADAFFPLVLLHWGRSWVGYQNLLLIFVLPLVLSGVLLLILVTRGTRLSLRAGVLAGICLLLLPLCGGAGVVVLPPWALWLGYVGLGRWRSGRPHAKREAIAILAFPVAVLLLMGLYLQGGLSALDCAPPSPSVRNTVIDALKVLANSLGKAAEPLWPLSGLFVPSLLLVSMGSLAFAAWRHRSPERVRVVGLLLFLGFVVGYALLLGHKRSGWCFTDYYGLLPSLGLCAAYYIGELYGTRQFAGFIQICLFSLVVALFPLNAQWGLQEARNTKVKMAAVERDLRAGYPPYKILAHHSQTINPFNLMEESFMSDRLRMLRDARVGAFQFMSENPSFEEVSAPIVPVVLHNMTFSEGRGQGTGNGDPFIGFDLPQSTYVCGIRLKYAQGPRPDTAQFRMSWRRSEKRAGASEGEFVRLGPLPEQMTVWMDDTIDEFRFHPDTTDPSCSFQLSEITLLVLKTGAPATSGR